MAEYIEREALKKALKNSHDDMMQDEAYYGKRRLWYEALSYARTTNILDKIPTADVVEVVRCKDCVHHTEDIINAAVLWCEKSGLAHLRDYYCADGKGEGE